LNHALAKKINIYTSESNQGVLPPEAHLGHREIEG
jgi:hypothetical protein